MIFFNNLVPLLSHVESTKLNIIRAKILLILSKFKYNIARRNMNIKL
jgi:hypothetical protein